MNIYLEIPVWFYQCLLIKLLHCTVIQGITGMGLGLEGDFLV